MSGLFLCFFSRSQRVGLSVPLFRRREEVEKRDWLTLEGVARLVRAEELREQRGGRVGRPSNGVEVVRMPWVFGTPYGVWLNLTWLTVFCEYSFIAGSFTW